MSQGNTAVPATFVEVAGKKTQLTEQGSGAPLLYLHSAGGETEWLPFHEALAAQFHVRLPAHPGFALSEGLEDIHDVADYAWHYVDFLKKVQQDSTHIVGFSVGGWIGTELAVLRPANVRRLVLVASAGLHIDGAPMAELFQDNMDALRELLFYDPDSELARGFFPESLEDPRILLWMRAREATARVGWNPYLHNPRLRGHLHRVEAPTLVIWGRHDRVIPLSHGEAFAREIPGARLEVIEECGHMVPLEQPERLTELIGDFLAE